MRSLKRILFSLFVSANLPFEPFLYPMLRTEAEITLKVLDVLSLLKTVPLPWGMQRQTEKTVSPVWPSYKEIHFSFFSIFYHLFLYLIHVLIQSVNNPDLYFQPDALVTDSC
jgi:hypothetical protein